MLYDRISLISEMLDATLNLRCFYIKGLDKELSFLKESVLPIFMNNTKEIDKFRNMLIHMVEEHVYIVDNFNFGNYIIICLDKLNESYLFIGPYLSEHRYEDLLRDIDEIGLSHNIYDKNVDLKFIYKRKLKKQDFKDVNSHRITTTMLDYRFIEESIRWDKKLIHCVSSGSKVNSVKILDKIFDLYFIDEESYNIRKYQNKLIYYNTLLLDLLIEKDFGNLYATGLFQRYMEKIEGARFIRDIKNIFYDMIMDYCFAISEFSVKHYSVLVGKAINYINSNLENNLSVSEIANQLYVSPTYLSRAFKKETGFSIIEYINKLKIKHATFLLRDTALPIQDIGRIIGINDVNYFSRLFKRYMSQTPTQYRKIFN